MSSLAINDLSLVGVNYHNADIEIREKFSVPTDEANNFSRMLLERDLTRESIVLSTCNRTELYCLSAHPDLVLSELISRNQAYQEDFSKLFYIKRGREMIQHAFTVASGLDSMILGEPEILGQMKNAYQAAKNHNLVGNVLTQLFERSFSVAKKVRTETAISREAISAPAICMKLSERIFGDISKCSVLCIGAGTIIETALTHLSQHKPKSLTIVNRTQSHANELATTHNAEVMSYEKFINEMYQFDIVFTATSSVLPVIGKGSIERAIKRRKRKPISIFDLAVPRDVEVEVGKLEDIFLYTIDDIGEIAGINLAKRKTAADNARSYIETATTELIDWFDQREAVDVIKKLRTRYDTIRDAELKQAIDSLKSGNDPQEIITALANRLTNRYAHDPIQSLREKHTNQDIIDELDNWYKNEHEDNGKDTKST